MESPATRVASGDPTGSVASRVAKTGEPTTSACSNPDPVGQIAHTIPPGVYSLGASCDP